MHNHEPVSPLLYGQGKLMTAPVRNASNGQFPGRVTAVHGSVIDVSFPAGGLPNVEEAIVIEADPGELLAEVQQHLGPTTIRAVALENTAGLRRGAKARATGAPVRVPVGEAVLGRLLNATGEPADRGPPLPADIERRLAGGPG